MGLALEPDALAREIVQLAVQRGGPDNATVVIVFVDEA
jgi:serine/threonine protein phosphatase PrpC